MVYYAKNKNIDRVANEYMQEFADKNGLTPDSKLYQMELDEFIKRYVRENAEKLSNKEVMKANQTMDYLEKCMTEYKEDGAYNYEEENLLTVYFDILQEFIEEFKASHSSILVKDFIEYLTDFLEASLKKDCVPIISSVHSMKGGEADTVYIYNYPRFPYKWKDMTSESAQQESNLQYVAITRAKHKLYLILTEESIAKSPEHLEKIIETNQKCIDNVARINRLY
jgi:superfamily I DNA/RNA helicase